MMMMDDISDASRLWPQNTIGRFNDEVSHQGGVFSSPQLTALAKSFTRDDYNALVAEQQGYDRPVSYCYDQDGARSDKDFSTLWGDDPRANKWHRLMKDFGQIIKPGFTGAFDIRLLTRSAHKEIFHRHPGEINAVLALEDGALSTCWENARKEIIRPDPNSLVMFGPDINHASPLGERTILIAHAVLS